MFRCQMCETVVPAGTRSTKVVTATRARVYEARGQDPRERRGGPRTFRGRRGPRKRKPYDKGGEGTEIVRELSVCPSCAAERANLEPEMVHVPPAMDLEAASARLDESENYDSDTDEETDDSED